MLKISQEINLNCVWSVSESAFDWTNEDVDLCFKALRSMRLRIFEWKNSEIEGIIKVKSESEKWRYRRCMFCSEVILCKKVINFESAKVDCRISLWCPKYARYKQIWKWMYDFEVYDFEEIILVLFGKHTKCEWSVKADEDDLVS